MLSALLERLRGGGAGRTSSMLCTSPSAPALSRSRPRGDALGSGVWMLRASLSALPRLRGDGVPDLPRDLRLRLPATVKRSSLGAACSCLVDVQCSSCSVLSSRKLCAVSACGGVLSGRSFRERCLCGPLGSEPDGFKLEPSLLFPSSLCRSLSCQVGECRVWGSLPEATPEPKSASPPLSPPLRASPRFLLCLSSLSSPETPASDARFRKGRESVFNSG